MRRWQNSDQKQKIVLVLGTGRCGTSTTAKILHKKLNICMGERFRGKHYEDLDFKDNDDALFVGMIGFDSWLNRTETLISQRRKGKTSWGYKSPRSTVLAGIYLTLISQPEIIFCFRESYLVIDSMMREYGWKREDAAAIAAGRSAALSNVLEGRKFLTLDFSKRLDDDEIESNLRKYLEEP